MASLPKTIGQRFYSEETRLLKYKIVSNDLATAALSLGIFVVAFVENEFFFDNDNKSNDICLTLRIFNCMMAVLMSIGIYRHYDYTIKDLITRKMIVKETNILTSSLRWSFLVELCIACAVTPPFLDQSINENQLGRTFTQSLDSYIFVFMVSRFYIFIRVFAHLTYWTGERAIRVCEFNGFRPTSTFAIKAYLKTKAFSVMTICLVVSVVLLGLVVRAFERSFKESGYRTHDFDVIWNTFWCMIVTMTTVGYGDIFALTQFGRLFTIIACIFGNFLLSLVVVALNNYITLSPQEDGVFEELTKKKLIKSKLEKDAVEVIQQFFKLKKLTSTPGTETRLKIVRRIDFIGQLNRFKIKRRIITYVAPEIPDLISKTYESFDKIGQSLIQDLIPIRNSILPKTTKALKAEEGIHLRALRSLDLSQKAISLCLGKTDHVVENIQNIDSIIYFYDENCKQSERKAEVNHKKMLEILDLENAMYKAKDRPNFIL